MPRSSRRPLPQAWETFKTRKVFKEIVTFIESELDAQRSGWMTSMRLSRTTLRLSMRKPGQEREEGSSSPSSSSGSSTHRSAQRRGNLSCPHLDGLGCSTIRPIPIRLTEGSPTSTRVRPASCRRCRSLRCGFLSNGQREAISRSPRGTRIPKALCPRPAYPRSRTPATGLRRGSNKGIQCTKLTHRSSKIRLTVLEHRADPPVQQPAPALPSQQPAALPVQQPAALPVQHHEALPVKTRRAVGASAARPLRISPFLVLVETPTARFEGLI